jgi:hypothetical protein
MKNWNVVYAVVLCSLVLMILLLAIFNKQFA